MSSIFENSEEKLLIRDEYIDMTFFDESQAISLFPNRSILKINITPGEDANSTDNLSQGTYVWVRFEGRKTNGELLDKSFSRFEKKKLRLFIDNYIPGLHYSIASMKKNEISWFKISPEFHHFSHQGEKNCFTANEEISSEPLFYKIELIDYKILQKQLDKFDFQGRIAKFEESRTKGNEVFHKNEFEKALKFYKTGLELLLKFPKAMKSQLNTEESEKLSFYANTLYGNAALCKMRQKKWYEAIKFLNEAKRLYNLSSKLNLRKAICYFHVQEFEKTKEICKELIGIKDLEEDVRKLLKESEETEKKQKILEKRRFSGFFKNWEKEKEIEKIAKKKRKIENHENETIISQNDDEWLEKFKKGVIVNMSDPCNEINLDDDEDANQ